MKHFSHLTPEERKLAEEMRQETLKMLKERVPERTVFMYGTSTPWHKAILTTRTKV